MVKKKITEAVTSNDPMSKRWRATFAAARMAYSAGEFHQAESLLARALEGARQLPEHHFAVPATEVAIAAVLLAKGRSEDAVVRLQKVITSLEGASSRDSKELLAVALRFQAQASAQLQDVARAEGELQKSIEILQALGPDSSVQLAYSFCDLCGLYLAQERFSEAEVKIVRAMQILSDNFGSECPEYVRADMIYAASMPMQSESHLDAVKEGIGKMEYMYGSKHPNIARALEKYCAVLRERGDAERLEEVQARFGIKT